MLVESGTERTRCRAYLKEKLDSLNGSDSCLGDGGGDSSGQEILGKRNGGLTHLRCFVFAYLCVVAFLFFSFFRRPVPLFSLSRLLGRNGRFLYRLKDFSLQGPISRETARAPLCPIVIGSEGR